jgi:acyl carrier protein
MGLDIVEFVMGVEERFGIEIPDDEAQRLTTPRLLVDYIMTRVKAGQDRGCLTQREFHRLRRALIARHWGTRRDVKPDTLLEAIVPRRDRRTLWQQLGEELQSARWPQLLRPKYVVVALIGAVIAVWFLPLILSGDDIVRGDLTPVWLSVFSTIAVTGGGLAATRQLREVFPPVYSTVGGVAQHLVGTRQQPEKIQEGWTREEVREAVRALIIEHLAVTDFTDDSRFVQDMHIN